MIIDSFARISDYYWQIPNLERAIAFIKELGECEPKRYDFDGGYIIYQEQETKPVLEGTYENHERYIDIQALIEGEDWNCLWNHRDNMEVAIPYDEVKDATRWQGERGALISLKAGMFVCFFPDDCHKPDRFLEAGKPTFFKKFVIKLEIGE